MADTSASQDGLKLKLRDIGSRLGWFDEPIDDIIGQISKELDEFKLEDSNKELRNGLDCSKQINPSLHNSDDDVGKPFNSIEETNSIKSPLIKSDDDSPFTLPQKSLRERVLKRYNPEHSTGDSDSDDLGTFLEKVRTPKPLRWSESPEDCDQSGDNPSKPDDFDDFIVDDDCFLEEYQDEEVFVVEDDSDEEKENFKNNFTTPVQQPHKITGKTTGKTWKTPTTSTKKAQPRPATDIPRFRRPHSALDSIITPFSTQKEFKKNKEILVKELFHLYNSTVFENQLPSDFTITWNNKMRSTAGFCYYGRKNGASTARIELADKVIDSADRLRDTLIHEMCHAATWLINGVRAGHGPVWKKWARRANFTHQDLPPISRCHSYKINAKFTYLCTNEFCSNSIGRHSKSLDLNKYRCAYCHSRFELQPQLKKDGTPQSARTPNKFAQFVKDNYGQVRKAGMAHKDVMKELSSQFSTLSSK